ncbi:histidine kinase dimerization/phosphoacceptor domain-containing protein, partial [Streptomyces sp. NPDC007070]|uniref:histidine kinase dimerization/phosphoacceptor domain-containing protein n=1 Tax=Streptomyces sp. NPDC007070 TaxID=3154312 RepID=UPI0033FA59EC
MLAGSHFASRGQHGHREPLDGAAYALLLLACVPLLWRHRHPAPAAYGTAAATLAYLAAGYPYGPVFAAVAVACFSAVVAGRRRDAWTSVGALWAGNALIALWLYRWLPPPGDGPSSVGQQVVVATWVVAVVALSELARARREQWARERAERAQAARRRADEERLRIARELHDVLAHSISVINVQAGAGLALLDSDPEQARTALTAIRAASKEALGEVRQVLDTLRAPGDAPRAPAPGRVRVHRARSPAGRTSGKKSAGTANFPSGPRIGPHVGARGAGRTRHRVRRTSRSVDHGVHLPVPPPYGPVRRRDRRAGPADGLRHRPRHGGRTAEGAGHRGARDGRHDDRRGGREHE